MTAASAFAFRGVDLCHESDVARAGKQLAMLLYCLGARSFVGTQKQFNSNPLWRSA